MTIDGTFETGATGWTTTSCTFVQSTDFSNTGTHSGKLTVTGTPTTAKVQPTTSYPATAGAVHELAIYAYSATATSNFSVAIDWINASNSVISTTTLAVAIPTGGGDWTPCIIIATAPAGTTQAKFGPVLSSSPATGKVIYVDDVTFGVVSITAVQDSAWPPRNLVEASGFASGDVVSVYRVIAGQRSVLRGGDSLDAGDTAAVISDGEYPFGVPFTYLLTLNGVDAVTTALTTYSLPGDKVALSDAITGLSAEVIISSWPDKVTDRPGTRFTVGGQNVAVLSPPGGAESSAELFTDTDSAREQLTALLTGSTSGMVLLRMYDSLLYQGYDGYYAVTDNWTETRWLQDGTRPQRLWTLDLVEVPPWSSALLASGWTLADIETVYDGGTLADLAGDFGTLLDIEVYDWGSAL